MSEETTTPPQEISLRPLAEVIAWASTNNDACKSIERRDFNRLSDWVELKDWPSVLGITLPDPKPGEPEDDHEAQEWEPYSVLTQALADARFGKSKFEDGRGLSTNLMFDVCAMWAYALGWDDLLETHRDGYTSGWYSPGPFFDAMIARLEEATNVD